MSNTVWPFFCFYGGKWRAGKRYPDPDHIKIIEPFAGGAGYSLRHPELDVHLNDLDPYIAGTWEYLISVSEKEIRSLPLKFDHVDELNIADEAKWLIGWWLNKGAASPCKTPSSWMRSGKRPNSFWGEAIRERIASQLKYIRHWTVSCQDYKELPDEPACWFVDPPYENKAGRLYRFSDVDYSRLAIWCRSRSGQVIVCEQTGAKWLLFQPFGTIKANPSSRGKGSSKEAIWKKGD